MADIQLQIQDIIKQANIVNNQLADIENILLQVKKMHEMQIEGDIYNISYIETWKDKHIIFRFY